MRPISSLILVPSLLLSLPAVAATLAAGTSSELQKALTSAVPGDTIQLKADIDANFPVVIDMDRVTLQGGGFTLSTALSRTPVLTISGADDVTITDLNITGASGDATSLGSGIRVASAVSRLSLQNVIVFKNSGHGIAMDFTGEGDHYSFKNITVTDNGGIGMVLVPSGSIETLDLVDSELVRNAGGLAGFGASMVNWSLTNTSFVSNAGSAAPNQGGFGAAFVGPAVASQALSGLKITNCKFEGNHAAERSGQVAAGLWIASFGKAKFSGIKIASSSFNDNGARGVYFDRKTKQSAFTNLSFSCNTVRENGVDGMDVAGQGIEGLALLNNSFGGNPNAGLNNQSSENVDATSNEWNSPTGPTHKDNRGGTGDVIIGKVEYMPFQKAPSCTGPVHPPQSPTIRFACEFDYQGQAKDDSLHCEAHGSYALPERPGTEQLKVECDDGFKLFDPAPSIESNGKLVISGTETPTRSNQQKTARIISEIPSIPGETEATLKTHAVGELEAELEGSCKFWEEHTR